MATNQTTNYQLNQWEPTDQVLHTDFNADNAKVDAALAGLASAVALCGNCKIEYGSYVGTGTYIGRSLTFSGIPLIVLIRSAEIGDNLLMTNGVEASLAFLEAGYHTVTTTPVRAIWTGNTVTWSRYYSEDGADECLNGNRKTYYYFALIDAAG